MAQMQEMSLNIKEVDMTYDIMLKYDVRLISYARISSLFKARNQKTFEVLAISNFLKAKAFFARMHEEYSKCLFSPISNFIDCNWFSPKRECLRRQTTELLNNHFGVFERT